MKIMLSAFIALVAGMGTAQAGIVLDPIHGDPADAEVRKGDNNIVSTTDTTLWTQKRVGGPADANWRNTIFVFDLSEATLPVASASLSVYYEGYYILGVSQSTSAAWRLKDVDLWFVGYSDAADDFPAGVTYLADTTDPNPDNVKLVDNFVSGRPNADQWFSTGDLPALVDVLNDRPVGGDFVFFRLNNVSESDSNNTGHTFASADNQDYRPYLDVTLIPEPSTLALLGLAGLALLKRRRI